MVAIRRIIVVAKKMYIRVLVVSISFCESTDLAEIVVSMMEFVSIFISS